MTDAVTPIELVAGDLRLVIDPACGAGIRRFDVRSPVGEWVGVMRGCDALPRHFNELACYVLAPYCNRVADGRLTFRGVAHELLLNWRDAPVAREHAIHGVACREAWAVEHADGGGVRCALSWPGGRAWPWPFDAVAAYTLDEHGVSVSLSLTNTADEPVPAGLGLHPYFPRRLWDDGDLLALELPNAGLVPSRAMIPSGPARPDAVASRFASGGPIGNTGADHTFVGWGGRARLAWPASGVVVRIEASESFGFCHVFTRPPADADATRYESPRWFVAVEPVTQIADAVNQAEAGRSDTGLVVLEPGRSLEASARVLVDLV